MKKPDRFDRIVAQWGKKLPALKVIALEPEMAKLLRREHAAVVRMVTRELLLAPLHHSDKVFGWNDAVTCILELLKRRRR